MLCKKNVNLWKKNKQMDQKEEKTSILDWLDLMRVGYEEEVIRKRVAVLKEYSISH